MAIQMVYVWSISMNQYYGMVWDWWQGQAC